MRIVHIVLSGPYTDYCSYQENMLAKYHKLMGLETFIIASEWMYDSNGTVIKGNNTDYFDRNGVHVIRLRLKGKDSINKKIRRYYGLRESLEMIRPDIIFHHGCQSIEELLIAKYCRENRNARLYIDNHSDYSNSATSWISKTIQHKVLWRFCAKCVSPYVKKFYGVLPARVAFITELYKVPKEKVELLVMGADDELVAQANDEKNRLEIRKKLGYKQDDFLIVSGGKIDKWKKQTILLMDAVNRMSNPHIKLLVFGSVVPELKDELEIRCSNRVQFIGWINTEQSYSYFAAGNLACFPGRHSVFWEQVAGQGIPMICKYWEGTTHVDKGGNVKFLYKDSAEEMEETICKVIDSEYEKMKNAAMKNAFAFSYSSIAKKAIELYE